MALSQKAKNIIAAIGMSKSGFRGHMDRQYAAQTKTRKEEKEKEKFTRQEDYKHRQKLELAEHKAGLKDPKQTPEEKFAEFQRKEKFKERQKIERDEAKIQSMSVDEYRDAVQKAAEKGMDVSDYLEGAKSEQEAALQARRGSSFLGKALSPVGAAQTTIQKLGQRYFGKKDEQTASTQASQEPIAVNRKTGERIVYRGGKWQPLK